MARPAPPSLTLRAVLYVVAICAAIVAFEGWREWNGHSLAVGEAERDAQNLARSLRHHAEDTYEIAEQAVSMVVYELGETGIDASRVGEAEAFMLRLMQGAGRLHSITVFGPDGRWLATTAENLPPGENHSGYAYFEAHRSSASDAPVFGAPLRFGGEDAAVTTVSRRIEDASGRFGGVVVAAVDSRYFSSVYDDIDVGSAGTITLYDSAGRMLATEPYRAGLIGTDHSDTELFTQRLASTDTGNWRFTAADDGVARIGGYDSSDRYPLVAVVAVSQEHALQDWRHGALLRGLLTIGFTIAVALLGLRLADQLLRRQKSEAVLKQKEAEFRLLAESASDLVERFDADGTRTYISPALERLTGYTPDELIGHNAFEIVHDDDRPAVEAAAERLRVGASEQETVTFRRLRKDGAEIWLETSLRVAAEASGRFSVVGVTRDISDRKRLELALEGMAMRDGLTGLANRRAFDVALARELARSRRTGTPLSLLMIDADRFKRFNDDHGHLAGDACLMAIASVVALVARRPTDLAARYGGEELALLLPDTDLGAARAIANDLCRQVQALAIPHARNLPWNVATVSVGVATIDPRDEDAVHDSAWLIRTADLALYDAKSQGRNQYISAPQRLKRLAG